MVDEGLFTLIPEDQEAKESSWQSIAGRFKQSLEEHLKPFSPVIQDEYEGMAITSVRNFQRPLIKDFVDPHYKESYGAPPSISQEEMKRIAELKGGVLRGSVDCYRAKKLEKITLVQLELVQRYYGIILNIWPADDYALPILTLTIDESPNYTHFFVDFIPLADCVVDTPYLEEYLDPLEPVWRTYKFVRDLPNFPTFEVNLYSWMRALRSPYLITRRVPPNKPKGIREDLIRLGLDYLTVYRELWIKDEPQDKTYISSLNERKKRIRQHFRTGKDPDGKFWWKGESYLGKELTHLLVNTCY